MPSINAVLPQFTDPGPRTAATKRFDTESHNDERSDFRKLMHKSQQDQGDTETSPREAASSSHDERNSQTKSDRPRKKAKDDVSNTVASPVIDSSANQTNTKPDLQAFLSLLSFAVDGQKKEAETPAVAVAATVKPDKSAPADATPVPQKLDVAPSFDPILLSGASYAQNPAVPATTSTPVAVAVSTSPVALSAKRDSLLIDTQQAPESSQAPAKMLAFAMRLGSAQPSPVRQAETAEGAPPPSVQALLDGNGAALRSAASESGEKNQTGGNASSDHNVFGAAYLASGVVAGSSADKASFATAAQDVRSTQTEPASSSTATPDPLRNILLQLKSDDNRRVDVRLIDRGGELHVSVKSADPALAQQLQEHIPELTSRLNDQQFNHDLWLPKLNEVARPAAADNNAGSFTESGSHSGQPNNSSSQQQHNQHGQSRPDWIDLLENQIS